MRAHTRYAQSGGLHIGYQVFGAGPPDVAVLDQWFGNVDAQWDLEPLARFLERLGAGTVAQMEETAQARIEDTRQKLAELARGRRVS